MNLTDLEKSVFYYLDLLRESGECNMFESGKYVKAEFSNLNEDQVRELVLKWMKTFQERKKEIKN